MPKTNNFRCLADSIEVKRVSHFAAVRTVSPRLQIGDGHLQSLGDHA
jgi:hypothetical protein